MIWLMAHTFTFKDTGIYMCRAYAINTQLNIASQRTMIGRFLCL